MIKEETAVQIADQYQKLAKINYCLKNIERLSSAEMEVRFSTKGLCNTDRMITETFQIPAAKVTGLLKEMEGIEKALLEKLSEQAMQEAQNNNEQA
jgi:hypothetical protein